MSWKHKKILPTPIVGAVRAGDPIVADERVETVLPMPAELVGSYENCFMLTVRGDSMINAGIMEGDLDCGSAGNRTKWRNRSGSGR